MDVGLEIQRRLSKAVYYNKWIFEKIQPYLGSRIVEVGASIGNLSFYFLNCEKLVALDVSDKYLRVLLSRLNYPANVKTVQFDISDQRVTEIKRYHIDTIVCINVLEHVRDDRKALRNMWNILEADGRIILLVPSLKILYGSMDRADNHFRRYSRKELTEKLVETGFLKEKLFYMNFIGCFGWFFNGRILKRKIIPEKQLAIYDHFIPLLSKLENRIRLPFGQSLIFIGKKQE
jgi:SAM-dependent methyltransferase